MATLLQFLGALLLGAFGIWFAAHAKRKEQEKENARYVETAPDADPAELADIDRMQDNPPSSL